MFLVDFIGIDIEVRIDVMFADPFSHPYLFHQPIVNIVHVTFIVQRFQIGFQ